VRFCFCAVLPPVLSFDNSQRPKLYDSAARRQKRMATGLPVAISSMEALGFSCNHASVCPTTGLRDRSSS
jgi:hypothetical protein